MPESEKVKQTVLEVLAGDRDAYRILVRDYRLMIRSYLGSQLHRSDEMDDLAQEVFLTAYKNLDKFELEADFGAWLRGIARNRLLAHFRSVGRRRVREAKFREEVTQLLDQDLERNFFDQHEFAIEALLRCIAKLPERMKHVVRAGLDGTKASELADELTTSVGAIYNLHYRANMLLRKCVKGELE
ncbi:MAG: sigma-70 family RNA polymerase sigma factor [Planctomycetota bacterium]